MIHCTIPERQKQYAIEIQHGILDDSQQLAKQLEPFGKRFAIITDSNLADTHAKKLYESLREGGLKPFLFYFPSGEVHKTRSTKELLEDQLFAKGLGKDTCIIALGGGVVTDLVGYVAATFCRGVPLVLMPTSLLGMVDASIGGKNGVNLPYGKNLIGCIYQPKKILIDPSFLQTLPLVELRNGVAEMIKHGLILDRVYLDFLDQHVDGILKLDPKIIQEAILRSCQIKVSVVEKDEQESGVRNILNFGHTIGHALEQLMHFSIPHGEAVAIGMLVEGYMATQLGHLHPRDFDRIKPILIKFGLPLKVEKQFSDEEWLQAMSYDKKSIQGIPRFVILNGLGYTFSSSSEYCMSVDRDLIIKALKQFEKNFYVT